MEIMKTKTLAKDGSNYPKEKIMELVETFGLFVDRDQWDVEGKEWMRIKSRLCPEAGCIILYKDHLEVNVHQEKELMQREFQEFLMKIGEVEFKKKIKNLMEIES